MRWRIVANFMIQKLVRKVDWMKCGFFVFLFPLKLTSFIYVSSLNLKQTAFIYISLICCKRRGISKVSLVFWKKNNQIFLSKSLYFMSFVCHVDNLNSWYNSLISNKFQHNLCTFIAIFWNVLGNSVILKWTNSFNESFFPNFQVITFKWKTYIRIKVVVEHPKYILFQRVYDWKI